jgi:hypothetical protein
MPYFSRSSEVAGRLVVAGTPDDWLRWLPEYSAAGLFGERVLPQLS